MPWIIVTGSRFDSGLSLAYLGWLIKENGIEHLDIPRIIRRNTIQRVLRCISLGLGAVVRHAVDGYRRFPLLYIPALTSLILDAFFRLETRNVVLQRSVVLLELL